jgi:hypothetical protein
VRKDLLVDKDLLNQMDFDNLNKILVFCNILRNFTNLLVVVVDQEDIQMMDWNFDKDFLVVDRGLVDNHHHLKK